MASDRDTAKQAAEPVYAHKKRVDADTDAILGARLADPHAAEVISLVALAMRHNLCAS